MQERNEQSSHCLFVVLLDELHVGVEGEELDEFEDVVIDAQEMDTGNWSIYELFFVVVLTVGNEIHESLHLVHVDALLLHERVLYEGQKVHHTLYHLGPVLLGILTQETIRQSAQNILALPGDHAFVQIRR